jgi:8-hydroxy-5-deazaflavin:NADPH oxidoreductase
MRVGVLGSGLMGGKLGLLFAHAGHEVVFSYARSEEKLKRLARDVGGKARAGTPRRPPGTRTPSSWPCPGRGWTTC